MKNALALNQDTKQYDGEALFVRKISGEAAAKKESLEEERARFTKHFAPKWLIIVCGTLTMLGLGLIAIFLELLGDEVFNQNLFIMLYVGLGLAIIGGVGLLVFILRVREVVKSKEFAYFCEREKKAIDEAKEQLGVPSDAVKIYVFRSVYVIRNNKKKYLAPCSARTYLLRPLWAYRNETALFLSDAERVMRIPHYDITRFVRKNEFISYVYDMKELETQEKEITFTKEEKKKYSVKASEFGAVKLKPYNSLQFHCGGEEFELLIAPFSEDAVTKLTGRAAE